MFVEMRCLHRPAPIALCCILIPGLVLTVFGQSRRVKEPAAGTPCVLWDSHFPATLTLTWTASSGLGKSSQPEVSASVVEGDLQC